MRLHVRWHFRDEVQWVSMLGKTCVVCLLAALVFALPASDPTVHAADPQYFRIATLGARGSELAKDFAKLDRAIRAATKGSWSVLVYFRAIAGDEGEILRRMWFGQIDASTLSAAGLSQIAPEAAVLTTPGVFPSYAAWDAARGTLIGDFTRRFNESGYKVLAWSELGQLRWFAKDPLARPAAIQHLRPWAWPNARALNEMLSAAGGFGVFVHPTEVYSALQTGLINMVTSTCVTLVSQQWQSLLKYMTKTPLGVLPAATLIRADRWQSLPPEVTKVLVDEIARSEASAVAEIRRADDRACQQLQQRGYTANDWTGEVKLEADKMYGAAQRRLLGRWYTPDQLAYVKKLAAGK
jgi:TRAP-type C4-dicarboxylate transport system substrate-binding protein